MNIADKLLKMKDQIDQAKSNIARLEGKQDQMYKVLNDNYQCKTIEEAEDQLNKIGIELDKNEQTLVNGISHLENNYNWDL